VVIPEFEGQAISIPRSLALAESLFTLVLTSDREVYEVAVGVTVQSPGLDPDPVLSLYPAVFVLPKGDGRGFGQA